MAKEVETKICPFTTPTVEGASVLHASSHHAGAIFCLPPQKADDFCSDQTGAGVRSESSPAVGAAWHGFCLCTLSCNCNTET